MKKEGRVKTMLIYAHRGASGEFPEATEAAYQAAINQGADGFECDVRLTKDGQIICYHDSDTKRLSNLDLKIAETNYATLKEQINPYKLESLVDLAITNKKDLVIESKHPVLTGGEIERRVHKLLSDKSKEIKESGINIYLISFSFFATLRNKKSPYKTGYLINRSFSAKINPVPIIAANIEILKKNHSFVLNQISQGKQVITWTVNEADDLKLCQDLGVYAVITDYPAQVRNSLGYS